jgi:next-to-BRCA1 protein 1
LQLFHPQLRAIFSLPSSAHPFWVNVLFFPDDAQPARIKFKQHVCDQAE